MSGDVLCFVAIVLPEELSGRVREFQGYASEHFGSKRALHSPPHITLVPPFQIPGEEEHRLDEVIGQMHPPGGPFQVTLDGFGAFGNRVIFIHVEPSQQMEQLAVHLSFELRKAEFPLKEETRPFHPHVTVAFKDLVPQMFRKADDYFRSVDFHGGFEAEKVTLLKHQKGRWEIAGHFDLKPGM